LPLFPPLDFGHDSRPHEVSPALVGIEHGSDAREGPFSKPGLHVLSPLSLASHQVVSCCSAAAYHKSHMTYCTISHMSYYVQSRPEAFMAQIRIEMDRGRGWELRAAFEAELGAAQVADKLGSYALQYPHRALIDDILVATAQPVLGRFAGRVTLA
jgi:hypothetical protein